MYTFTTVNFHVLKRMLSQNQKKQTKKMVEKKKPLLRKEYEDYLKKAVLYPDYKNLQLGENSPFVWAMWVRLYNENLCTISASSSRL